jgi:transposase
MKPEEPVIMRFKTGRGKSITITGGICQSWPQSIFLISKKTNTESFLNFLKAVKAKIDLEGKPAKDYVIVLDNHSAHRSWAVHDYAVSVGFKLLFSPPTASEFNPIEGKIKIPFS